MKFSELPLILKEIIRLRPDLRSLYLADKNCNYDKFLYWVITSGIQEYFSLRESDNLKAFLKRRALFRDIVLTNLEKIIWLNRSDLQAAFPLPNRSEEYANWFLRHANNEYNLIYLCSTKNIKRNIHYKFGVNLIGYAYGQLGIGEDLRMVAKALDSMQVPYCIINFPPGKNIPQNQNIPLKNIRKSGPYFFNIFCLTAEETIRFFLEKGGSQFSCRYNIGYWPWELSLWPKKWISSFKLVDEVWSSSTFTYNSLAKIFPKPIRLMPMAVDIPFSDINNSTNVTRKIYKLPAKAYLFCFSFDLNSSIHRKNPIANIHAFTKAFPKDKYDQNSVGLVIKTHSPYAPNRSWNQLKAYAKQDNRIYIIEKTLSKTEVLNLYKSCDCFLSLHRAEGFGRGIAESLLLGLKVIATGYSGNVDFSNNRQTKLVDYNLITITRGHYPHHTNQVWAEPNINDAAKKMRMLIKAKGGVKEFQENIFNPVVVGDRYSKILNNLYKREKFSLLYAKSLDS